MRPYLKHESASLAGGSSKRQLFLFYSSSSSNCHNSSNCSINSSSSSNNNNCSRSSSNCSSSSSRNQSCDRQQPEMMARIFFLLLKKQFSLGVNLNKGTGGENLLDAFFVLHPNPNKLFEKRKPLLFQFAPTLLLQSPMVRHLLRPSFSLYDSFLMLQQRM